MSTYWDDLQTLQDISHLLIPEKSIIESYNDKDIEDFKESVQYFIQDFIDNNIKLYKKKDFEQIMYDALYELIVPIYGALIDQTEFNMEYHIYDAMEIYFYKNNAFRSYSSTTILKKPNKRRISKQLSAYKKREQPEQHSDEWFRFRREGLSASSIWKALDTQSNKNNIIYNKCKPLKIRRAVNIKSPMHNGHRYEPLSIIQYEFDKNTIVGEFGCISHSNYKFLKASPDGINIDPDSKLYGRLVEVKNPTTRELDGKPKKDYWIQMQLQMEVWDLDECDFLETVYKQYESETDFYNDGGTFTRTSKNKRKGIIIQFYDGNKPIYKYPQVDCSEEEFNLWFDNILEENTDLTWVTNIYWRLEDYSCVLVPRNRKWFNAIYPELKEIWDTILKERISGYSHRKPKSYKKKKLTPTSLAKFEENTKTLFIDTNMHPKIDKNQNVIIKVRTESFEHCNQTPEQ